MKGTDPGIAVKSAEPLVTFLLSPTVEVGFVPKGTSLEPMQGRVVLDVGNDLCPGIIDHHQPGDTLGCATELVAAKPELVLSEGRESDRTTLITHYEPDLDAVGATYLSYQLITHGVLPKHVEVLARYIGDVDKGIVFREKEFIETLYGVFTVMASDLSALAKQGEWTREKRSFETLEMGFGLLDYLLERMDAHANLHADIFFDDPDFHSVVGRLSGDEAEYKRDLGRAQTRKITLPCRKGGTIDVGALFLCDPQSLFFKHWARSGASNPEYPDGFPLLVICYQESRYVISLPVEHDAWLKGLGDKLEVLERAARESLSLVRRGRPRKGYDSSDPWYDGRNPLHDYSIVDTPINGTVLSRETIFSVVVEYGTA